MRENLIDIEINSVRGTRLNIPETYESRKSNYCIEIFSIILEKILQHNKKHYNTMYLYCVVIFFIIPEKTKIL